MRSLLSVAGLVALAGGRFAQTRLAAVLVWAGFWALLAATAQVGVGLAFGAWIAGYGASRLVWGRRRGSFVKGVVALGVAGVAIAPYWRLILP